jgi:integrase/recombinase XerD
MKHDEVIMRIVTGLYAEYGDSIDTVKVRRIIETVMYGYDVTAKETLPAIIDNMNDMIMLYLATKKTEGLSDNSIEQYGLHLRNFADSMRRNVEDISTMDIRVYLAKYGQTVEKNTSIATRTTILRGFFNWLFNEEYITKNPMAKIKTIKVEKRIREALTKEEFEILRGGCKTLRQKALLEVLYATACRLDEVENMKITDIDWNRLQLRVIGKGNKERIVYLSAVAQVHLTKYLHSRKDNCNALFLTERAPYKNIGDKAIQKEIKKIMKQSGLQKNVYPHLIRHTAATHLLNAGMNVTVLQEILGHESLDTTMIYGRISNSTVESEYRKCS